MTAETDAVLSKQTHIKDDHILVDLKLKDDFIGRLVGDPLFTRSTIGSFENNGIVKTSNIDVARFESNGILLEGTSKNELLNNEEFDNPSWIKSNTSVSQNVTSAPNGTLTADSIIENSANSLHAVVVFSVWPATAKASAPVYVKAGASSKCYVGNLSAGVASFFDLSTGLLEGNIGAITGSIKALDNGWFRISVTHTSASAQTLGIGIYRTFVSGNFSSSTTYTGNGTDNINLWRAQLEELAFASSSILTTGISTPRALDDLSISSSNIQASTEAYTISLEVDVLGLDLTKTQTVYSVDGETSRKIEINTTTGKVEATHGGVISISTTVVIPGTSVKVDFSVDDTNQTLYINNVQESQAVKGVVTGTRTKISVGNADGFNQLFGHIKNFIIYDKGLTSKEVVDPDLAIEFVTVDFDISFGTDGDILTDDFFDTSLLYSLLGERRADPSEVVEPQLRRGWIGSEDKDFENGSKLWLFEQARVTRSNLNRIEDEARKALQWLVDDGLVVSVDEVTATVKSGKITLEIVIRRSRSQVERRFFTFWQNTGVR